MPRPEWAGHLPAWRSHKIVRAAAIAGFDSQEHDGSEILRLAAGQRVIKAAIPPEVFVRARPEVGDYIVVYDDGYVSWSPKAAFEEGYTAVE